MAAISIQSASLDGLAESFAAASELGDTIADDGKQDIVLEVDNGSGESINVTITAVTTSINVSKVGPVTVSNKVVAVGAGARKIIGPFPDAYRNSQGLVSVSYSEHASVTVRALRVAKLD